MENLSCNFLLEKHLFDNDILKYKKFAKQRNVRIYNIWMLEYNNIWIFFENPFSINYE